MTTWRAGITGAMTEHGETWDDVVAFAPAESDPPFLDVQFDSGYGGHEGQPFTLWTKARVYFPVVYDGAEWVASVPRNPCDEITGHVGGE